jgi:hypothetical protein
VGSLIDTNVSEKNTPFFRAEGTSPEDGDSIFLRNVGIYRRVYTVPKLRRTASSSSPP